MLQIPVLLGLLWSLVSYGFGETEVSNKATNQVYSYTYHFQHNGTTDPKQFIQSILPDPPEGGSIVRTFFNPHLRGFVSKGYLPAGPINTGFGLRSPNPTFEGIKKLVDDNLRDFRPPPPPELIPVPPSVEEKFTDVNNEIGNHLHNNNRGFNGPENVQNYFPPVPRPIVPDPVLTVPIPPPQPIIDDNVVTRVQSFEKDLPDGKVYEKIETFSYNPPPTSNVVSRTERFNGGVRQSRQEDHRNEQGFGYRSTSYFRKEYRTGTPPHGQISAEVPSNGVRNNDQRNYGNPSWRVISDPNEEGNHDGRRNFVNPVGPVLNNINDPHFAQRQNDVRRGNGPYPNDVRDNAPFGHRLSNRNRGINHQHSIRSQGVPQNQNLVQHQQHTGRQGHHPNRPNQHLDAHHQQQDIPDLHNRQNNGRSFFNGVRNHFPNAPQNAVNRPANNFGNVQGGGNSYLNRNFDRTADNIIAHVNDKLNNLNGARHGGNSFSWDDDNKDWGVNHQNEWGGRLQKPGPDNGRPFSNGHSSPIGNPPANDGPVRRNPMDVLRSTLEALVGKELKVPIMPYNREGDGNYRNVNGGGIEKIFAVDRVVDGPGSFSRNHQRGFERNFHVDSNSGYQRSNQWSTNAVRRLDAQSSRDDFGKDFIDVFNDEY